MSKNNVSLKKLHKPVLEEMCITLHNCADCYEPSTPEPKCGSRCKPCERMDNVYDVTEHSFCIEPYSDKVNLTLIAIGHSFGYTCHMVCEDGQVTALRFFNKDEEDTEGAE